MDYDFSGVQSTDEMKKRLKFIYYYNKLQPSFTGSVNELKHQAYKMLLGKSASATLTATEIAEAVKMFNDVSNMTETGVMPSSYEEVGKAFASFHAEKKKALEDNKKKYAEDKKAQEDKLVSLRRVQNARNKIKKTERMHKIGVGLGIVFAAQFGSVLLGPLVPVIIGGFAATSAMAGAIGAGAGFLGGGILGTYLFPKVSKKLRELNKGYQDALKQYEAYSKDNSADVDDSISKIEKSLVATNQKINGLTDEYGDGGNFNKFSNVIKEVGKIESEDNTAQVLKSNADLDNAIKNTTDALINDPRNIVFTISELRDSAVEKIKDGKQNGIKGIKTSGADVKAYLRVANKLYGKILAEEDIREEFEQRFIDAGIDKAKVSEIANEVEEYIKSKEETMQVANDNRNTASVEPVAQPEPVVETPEEESEVTPVTPVAQPQVPQETKAEPERTVHELSEEIIELLNVVRAIPRGKRFAEALKCPLTDEEFDDLCNKLTLYVKEQEALEEQELNARKGDNEEAEAE